MSSMPPPPPPAPPGGFPPAPPPGYSPYSAAPAMGNYAGFGARLGGRLLDGLLYGLVGAVFSVPAIILIVTSLKDCNLEKIDSAGRTYTTCGSGQLKVGLLLAGIAVGAIGAIVILLLYISHLGKTGQTWGRKIVGVKVVTKDTGAPLGFARALGRTLIEQTISGICFLGFLWMLWDKDKQTWHDKIVNSVVVKV